MEASILTSTKKILGVGADYTAFDLDILTHINAALGVLEQVGIGPEGGLFIEDATTNWNALNLPPNQLSVVRSYVFLKTRMLFDPPTTSFLLEAMDKQITEFEWRLSAMREGVLHPATEEVTA